MPPKASARASLAKITRPSYTDVLQRERLFRVLDASAAPVTWIAAPAGAGKTTLASSYLAARRVAHLWYQLDRGDADLATFFHYLGLATRTAAPGRELALPSLTAEYLAGVRAFARRYFETLAAQLPAPFVLVFDNYQEVPGDAPLHAVLREGIAFLPREFRVLILSRTPPPASERIARLGWEDLQLTLEEVEGIERLRRRRAPSGAPADLHGKSSGWAAGVVLMLEQERAKPAAQAFSASDPKVLFDHFAGQVFAGLDVATQRVLAASALLPRMTGAMVEELAGAPGAGEVLEALHRKNYFTLKAESAYEYHPLFRDFLLGRSRAVFAASDLQALRRKAAALAESDGQLEAAAELLAACGAFEGVAQLVLRHAPALVTQGRNQVIEGWIASLPASVRAGNPWLSFWFGACRLPFNPPQARESFEDAHRRFKEQGDLRARCVAWCAIVDSYVYEWGNFKPLEGWLAEMQALLDAGHAPPDADTEAQVACGMFLALMYAQPSHPQMRAWEARVRQIILQGEHPALQAKVGTSLLIYYTWWIGNLTRAELLVHALRGQIQRPGVPPLLQITWDAMAAGFYWMSAENGECLACVDRGLDTARRNGVHGWDRLICSQGVFGSLSDGDADRAKLYLQRMEVAVSMSRPMDHAMFHYLSAWYRFAAGQLVEARAPAQKAVDMAEEAGAHFPAAVMRNDLGRVLFHLGEREAGLALVRQAAAEGRAMGARTIDYLTGIAEAEFALERGDEPACAEHLRSALGVGAAQGFVNQTWWSSALMSRLYAVALAHDIEPDYVSSVMRVRRLAGPASRPAGAAGARPSATAG